MNSDESYFLRTNWFIWIGFTTSIVMILLVGTTVSSEWEGKKIELVGFADHVIDALIVVGLVVTIWLQLKIRKLLLQQAVLQLTSPEISHSLLFNGKLSLFYALFLLSNEIFVGIGFYYGFILYDSTRFYYYGLASLACNFLTLPHMTLKKPKLPTATSE
jgi:hypothetical protein